MKLEDNLNYAIKKGFLFASINENKKAF